MRNANTLITQCNTHCIHPKIPSKSITQGIVPKAEKEHAARTSDARSNAPLRYTPHAAVASLTSDLSMLSCSEKERRKGMRLRLEIGFGGSWRQGFWFEILNADTFGVATARGKAQGCC